MLSLRRDSGGFSDSRSDEDKQFLERPRRKLRARGEGSSRSGREVTTEACEIPDWPVSRQPWGYPVAQRVHQTFVVSVSPHGRRLIGSGPPQPWAHPNHQDQIIGYLSNESAHGCVSRSRQRRIFPAKMMWHRLQLPLMFVRRNMGVAQVPSATSDAAAAAPRFPPRAHCWSYPGDAPGRPAPGPPPSRFLFWWGPGK